MSAGANHTTWIHDVAGNVPKNAADWHHRCMLALLGTQRIAAPCIHRVTSLALLDLFCCRPVHALRSTPNRCNMGIDIPHSGPVPPDYEISRLAKLKHISEIAKSLGLEESEYNLYGQYQAKVRVPDPAAGACEGIR